MAKSVMSDDRDQALDRLNTQRLGLDRFERGRIDHGGKSRAVTRRPADRAMQPSRSATAARASNELGVSAVHCGRRADGGFSIAETRARRQSCPSKLERLPGWLSPPTPIQLEGSVQACLVGQQQAGARRAALTPAEDEV